MAHVENVYIINKIVTLLVLPPNQQLCKRPPRLFDIVSEIYIMFSDKWGWRNYREDFGINDN